MPACQGRPDGSCPNNKSDSSVKFSVADLFLCEECSNYRFANIQLSDNTVPDGMVSAVTQKPTMNAAGSVNGVPHAHNELLCFLYQRSKALPFDDLVNLAVDFYTWEEVKKAHEVLSKFVKQRLPPHKGSNRAKATVSDLLKVIIDPVVGATIPVFYAIDISRLPAIGIDHVDVHALFQELILLRNEVRSFSSSRQDVQLVTQLQIEMNTLKLQLAECVQAHHASNSSVSATTSTLMTEEFPPLHGNSLGRSPIAGALDSGNTAVKALTTSQVLQNSVMSGAFAKTSKHLGKKSRPVITGKSANTKLKSVQVNKSVEIFVSRLSPDAECVDLVDNVQNIASVNNVHIVDINCVKLPSKFDSYSSFHVKVRVEPSLLHNALSVLLSGDGWPAGSIVRRFYVKRNLLQGQVNTVLS